MPAVSSLDRVLPPGSRLEQLDRHYRHIDHVYIHAFNQVLLCSIIRVAYEHAIEVDVQGTAN